MENGEKKISAVYQSSGRNKYLLDLEGNGLIKVGIDSQLSSLREINLSYNFLTGLPELLYFLNNLQKLTLEGNFISSFLNDRTKLSTSLTHLNLNFNRLISFPSSLKHLISLYFLSFPPPSSFFLPYSPFLRPSLSSLPPFFPFYL